MIRHYIKTAFRNLLKYKAQNIFYYRLYGIDGTSCSWCGIR